MLVLTESGKVIKDSGCLTGETVVACVMGKKDIHDAYGYKECGLVDGKIKKVLPRMDSCVEDQILDDQVLMQWIKYGKWTEKKMIGVDKKNDNYTPGEVVSKLVGRDSISLLEQKLKIAEMALKYVAGSDGLMTFAEAYKEIEKSVCQ
jgi:hypothetical protein